MKKDSTRELYLAVMNLSDAFLNSAHLFDAARNSPITKNPLTFHTSRRGRFERMWITLLYVLVQTWENQRMTIGRDFLKSIVSCEELEKLIKDGRKDGSLARMAKNRDYMCHRDSREYWDDGRSAVIGQLEFHTKLQLAFSKIILEAFSSSEWKALKEHRRKANSL